MGIEYQFCKIKRVLEIGYTTMNIFNTTQLYSKIVMIVNILCVFHQIFKSEKNTKYKPLLKDIYM